MNLEISPYAGVGPLEFGITELDLIQHLGNPAFRSKRPVPAGTVELEYPGVAAAFDITGRLFQVGFDENFEGVLSLDGTDLLNDEQAFDRLLELDGNPYLWVGFVMLMKLGIRLGGYHDLADEGKTVSVFATGRYDDKLSRFTPLKE